MAELRPSGEAPPRPTPALPDGQAVLADLRPGPAPLSEAPSVVPPVSARGGARVAGRLSNGLALVECDEELLILDPHALHERLIYERLRSEKRCAGQRLLIPEVLELAPAAREKLEEMLPFFQEAGFEIEGFGPDSFAVAAVPAILRGSAREAILAALEEHTPGETYREAVLRGVACRGAVKLSPELPDAEVAAVVTDAEERYGSVRAPELASCPHGRPVLLRMTFDEILRRLARR